MSTDLVKLILEGSRSIQAEADEIWKPPASGAPSRSEMVVYGSLVSGTRVYIETVVQQINGSYECGWYDACGVMIRRLVETLIIEAFEHHKIDSQIKNSAGDFVMLSDLITATLNCKAWNVSRNAKRALPRLKDVGDKSAHNRRYLAHRQDIDRIIPDLRDVTQELLILAGLK
jgi:uncharacterized protein YodC (DUF2158 family)